MLIAYGALVGKAIKDIPRDQVIISSKWGPMIDDKFNFTHDASPENARRALELSLKNLGVGYIDLYILRSKDAHHSIEDSVKAMAVRLPVCLLMTKSGKLRLACQFNVLQEVPKVLQPFRCFSLFLSAHEQQSSSAHERGEGRGERALDRTQHSSSASDAVRCNLHKGVICRSSELLSLNSRSVQSHQCCPSCLTPFVEHFVVLLRNW